MPVKRERQSWVQADSMCAKLASRAKREFDPHVLVGISRGGLVPLRLLSDHLNVRNIGTVGARFYKAPGETEKRPVITQPVNVNVRGKRVLVVDDVADSGRTLALVVKHLQRRGARQVKVATLHYKPRSVFEPHFYVGKTDKWIVYPWDKREHAS